MAQTAGVQTTEKSSKAKTMAELLASAKKNVAHFKKGDVIKGIVTKLHKGEILVDIQAKTEAVVLEKDKRLLRNLLNTIHVGDTVEVTVLTPESDLGHPVVSLRRFLEASTWQRFQKLIASQEQLPVTITEVTRGGFLVATKEGVSGFLPNSHISLSQQQTDTGMELIGKAIPVYVVEANKATRKLIFSQKPLLSLQAFEDAVSGIKIGDMLTAIGTNITPFGVFTAVKTKSDVVLDGLIHISEVSWDESPNLAEQYMVGQEIACKVIGIDHAAKRLDLSVKRLSKDPFETIAKAFAIDQKVNGIVKEISITGIHVALESPSEDKEIEGIIRKEKVPPNTSFEVGQKVTATVTQVDTRKHRIYLAPVLKEKPIGYR